MTMRTFYARNVDEVQACLRERCQHRPPLTHDDSGLPLRPVAGRSKSALSIATSAAASGSAAATSAAAFDLLDVSAISGVIEYQPDECTFTARAATTVAEIEAMLAGRGQYLPFEPPFAARGATLGGTVASGLSGPGRFRYGGVRDFVLGVRFVDGEGRALRGGGRVVKNAAGFYLQHLLLGSLGTLGVLTEVTCKVFPLPEARITVVADLGTMAAAIDTLSRLRRSTFELEAAELIPPARLLLRLGGSSRAIAARVQNLSAWLQAGVPNGGAGVNVDVRAIADGDDERQCWHEARELTWAPPAVSLVKVATTLGRLADLDRQLAIASPTPVPRRYGAGGDMAWIAWPHELARLDALLMELKMPGLVVLGDGSDNADGEPLLGPRPDPAFLARVRATLDPRGVFGPRYD